MEEVGTVPQRKAMECLENTSRMTRRIPWGRDGLAGISGDRQQRPCFALALWNESDLILKERLFGLTNSEGNHGEDLREYYFPWTALLRTRTRNICTSS